MSQTKTNLPVVNPHAAGIDIGSRTHFIAVGQNAEDVRSFGCYTADHIEASKYLKANGITSIAMESTGSYWKGLFQHLQHDGFEVILVNGKHTHNVKGRKTDVLDCQWIQRLHSLGLLSGSFLPDEFTAELRQYTRNREHLIEQGAAYVKKMKQSLRLMNIRLDVAIRDIMGDSGRAMVEAILRGNRDPATLASLANFRVKKSKEEIALSLEGNWKDEYLFELQMSYDLYNIFQNKIAECDKKIEQLLTLHLSEKVAKGQLQPVKNISVVKKKINKNAPKLDLQTISTQLAGGINLFQIEGVSNTTVLTLISETSMDLSKFPTAKHFASWLALSPNNKISGGKVLSSHVAHHNNKLAQALQRAANAIGNMKTGKLNQFFRRIAFKHGRMAAITATARKLAVILWNMLTKKEPYKYEETEAYNDRLRKLLLKNIQRKIKALNIQEGELKFTMA
jgi:transposase